MPTFHVRSGSVPADYVSPQRDEQISRLLEGIGRKVEIARDQGRVEITFQMDASDVQTAYSIAERALSEFAGDGSPWPGGTVVSKLP
jgi:hypothetical protein